MKLTTSKSLLYQRLSTVGKVIAGKSVYPILDNFLLQVSGAELTITASDGEVTLTTTLSLHTDFSAVEGEARFCINGKQLLSALKELPEQPIALHYNPQRNTCTLHYQNGHYSLVPVAADEYPAEPTPAADAETLSLPAPEVLAAIQSTWFAAAADELRPVMNGIYFDITPRQVVCVASDGHRLARHHLAAHTHIERAAFILHKFPAAMLRAALQKQNEHVRITFDGKRAFFQCEEYHISCRLIEGRYPNYNSVIPTQSASTATLPHAPFLSALRRAAVFTDNNSGLIRLDFIPGSLKLSAQNYNYSTSAEETVPCQFQGEPTTIGFKAGFLIETLTNLPAEEVRIEMDGGSRAALFTNADDADKTLLMLIMPMMVDAN